MVKDYIQEKHPKIHTKYVKLRKTVWEAWNSISEEDSRDMIRTIPTRCQDVIDTEGWYTKY